jgi:PAS domain S-box-containing protein
LLFDPLARKQTPAAASRRPLTIVNAVAKIVPPRLEDGDLWLVDSLVVPASLHDTHGTFVRINEAAERASGCSNAQLLGRHFTELLLPEQHEKVEELFRFAVESGKPTEFETVFTDASGEPRGVRAQHLPLRSGDEIVGVLILAFDALTPSQPTGLEGQPRLTRRQAEVLHLVASGLSTPEIAKRLTLSNETVRNHLRGVFTELHVHNRLEAIAAARRLGLLAPTPLRPQSLDQATARE